MGERSYMGHGPLLVVDLRAWYDFPAVKDHMPGLCELELEAWPVRRFSAIRPSAFS